MYKFLIGDDSIYRRRKQICAQSIIAIERHRGLSIIQTKWNRGAIPHSDGYITWIYMYIDFFVYISGAVYESTTTSKDDNNICRNAHLVISMSIIMMSSSSSSFIILIRFSFIFSDWIYSNCNSDY